MRIPHTFIRQSTLRSVILEFVTRDGTDHSPVAPRITDVLKQLEDNRVALHFDEDTKSCNIVQL